MPIKNWRYVRKGAVNRGGAEVSASALLGILGMSCETCARRVQDSLIACPGVQSVDIDLPHGLVKVDYDPRRTECKKRLEAVAGAGSRDEPTYYAFLL